MDNLSKIGSSLIFYFVAVEEKWRKMRAETYTRLAQVSQRVIMCKIH
jgi:hypothetical protein